MDMTLAQVLRYNALAIELRARERLQAIEDQAVPWMQAQDRHEHLERLRQRAGFASAKTLPGVRVIPADQVGAFLRRGG